MTGGLDERPEYGPSGYLPEKASRRARKIVLRAPLGLQWLAAAVVVGLVLVAVAVILLLVRPGGRPGPPFEAVGHLEAVEAARVDERRGVLYVGAAGRVRTFVMPVDDVPLYCAASGRLESRRGRVWSLTGRALDGGPSLEQHPTLVGSDRVVYVDFTRTLAGPPPEDTQAMPACSPMSAHRSRTRGA